MYQLRTESKTFGDVEVSVTEIDCFAQQDLWIALTQEAAPGLGGLGSLLTGGISGLIDSQEDVSALLPALFEALKGLSSKKLQALQLQTFASATAIVEGKMVPLRTVDGVRMAFGPQMDVMYEAWVFAAGVIFDRFLSRARSWLSAMKAKAEAMAAEVAKRKASSSSSDPS